MRIELFNYPVFGGMENSHHHAAAHNIPSMQIPEEIEEEILPSFSTEQLEAAERAGFEKGFEQGYASALAEFKNETYVRDNAVLKTMETIEQTLRGVNDAHSRFLEAQKAPLARLAIGIAKKVAGDAVTANPSAEVEPLIKRCLAMLVEEPKVSIHVHQSMMKPIEEKIEKITAANSFMGDVIVMEDANLVAGDCRIEWKNGSAERNTKALWQNIESMIMEGAKPAHATDTTGDQPASKIYMTNG